MAKTESPPINYEAWARNMITFIRERDLEIDFKHWSGGWPCPISPNRRAKQEGVEDGKPAPGVQTRPDGTTLAPDPLKLWSKE